jgi:hypothetical protein
MDNRQSTHFDKIEKKKKKTLPQLTSVFFGCVCFVPNPSGDNPYGRFSQFWLYKLKIQMWK